MLISGCDFLEGNSVHAVPEAAGGGAIGEYVAEVGIAGIADGFDPFEKCRPIEAVRNYAYRHRLSERRPAGTGLKFFRGVEENGIAAEARIDSRLEQTAHLGTEGAFGPGLPGDVVFLGA